MRRRRLNSRNDLSKAITASNLLVDGVQAATVIANHMKECVSIKQTSYKRYHNTTKHVLKS